MFEDTVARYFVFDHKTSIFMLQSSSDINKCHALSPNTRYETFSIISYRDTFFPFKGLFIDVVWMLFIESLVCLDDLGPPHLILKMIYPKLT